MDTLYIGDIPLEYHYFRFNDYTRDLELYSNANPSVDSDYYCIKSNSPFIYTHNYVIDEDIYATDINVSNKVYYRSDFQFIMIEVFIICLFALWFTNLFTSLIRKGGVLGGLF